jgi:hypothetical protein
MNTLSRESFRKQLAREGAKAFLATVDSQLKAIHREWPDLFPNGVPVVTPLEREPLDPNLKRKYAKRLVTVAEKKRLHWAQTPAGRKKMSRLMKAMHKKRRAEGAG